MIILVDEAFRVLTAAAATGTSRYLGRLCRASGLAFTRFSLERLSIFFASYSLWALYILENILEY